MSTVDLLFPILPIDLSSFGVFQPRGVAGRDGAVPAWNKLRGAYGATEIRTRACRVDDVHHMRAVASIFKAIFGHNAIVHPNYDFYARSALWPLVKQGLSDLYPEVELSLDESRPIEARRVDVVRHFQCDTEETLRLALAEILARASEVGVLAHCKSRGSWPTVAINGGSEYWEAKFYGKHQELLARGHKIPARVPHADEIVELMKHHLRCEVTLYYRQLKAWDMDVLSAWTPAKVNRVFEHALGKLRLHELDGGLHEGR